MAVLGGLSGPVVGEPQHPVQLLEGDPGLLRAELHGPGDHEVLPGRAHEPELDAGLDGGMSGVPRVVHEVLPALSGRAAGRKGPGHGVPERLDDGGLPAPVPWR